MEIELKIGKIINANLSYLCIFLGKWECIIRFYSACFNSLVLLKIIFHSKFQK